jgi:hypothetical protein
MGAAGGDRFCVLKFPTWGEGWRVPDSPAATLDAVAARPRTGDKQALRKFREILWLQMMQVLLHPARFIGSWTY